jgi:hypothetical protein
MNYLILLLLLTFGTKLILKGQYEIFKHNS